jgi:hypothetical protein
MPLSDDITNELGRQFEEDFGDIDDAINKCAIDRTDSGGAGGGGKPKSNPTDTAKQNYTAIRYGNDHGSISFGSIAEKADVTSAVQLTANDGRHQISMDKDGPRKGWTTITAPGNFQALAGMDNKEAQDSLALIAENGNILIKANNGKVRIEGVDVEIVAVGEGGSKGNIKMNASENITADSKKFLVNASVNYKIATSGTGEIIANGILKMYGSIIKGADDSCSVKNSKNNLGKIVNDNNKV